MPRSYIDRGLSLRTGEWLVMGHSATRIRGKPILAKFENAVERVARYFERRNCWEAKCRQGTVSMSIDADPLF